MIHAWKKEKKVMRQLTFATSPLLLPGENRDKVRLEEDMDDCAQGLSNPQTKKYHCLLMSFLTSCALLCAGKFFSAKNFASCLGGEIKHTNIFQQ